MSQSFISPSKMLFYLFIFEKDPVFPFLMLSAKQGNYWYHFITSLVRRGP